MRGGWASCYCVLHALLKPHRPLNGDAMTLDAKLLDILACPLCKGPLQYSKTAQVLVCRADRLAYPIRDDIPVMLEDEARRLDPQDPLLQER